MHAQRDIVHVYRLDVESRDLRDFKAEGCSVLVRSDATAQGPRP